MANRGNTWKVPAGMTEKFQLTVSNANGPITGVYAGTEDLPLVVWEGSNLAPIAGVCSAQWISGPDGTVQATVNPPADMEPGFYRVRLSVTYGGVTTPYHFGWIRVEAVAGSAEEAPVYGTLQDMIDIGGEWVVQMMQSEAGDATNFLAERARAREWLDDIMVGASRPFAYRFDMQWALYYGSYPYGPVEAPDSVIRDYLAADALMIRPRTIECVSYKALAYALEKRQTFDEKGDAYARRAALFHRKASNSLRRYRCELDIDADGKVDIAFNLGLISFR